jgi:hypothetical protein
MLAMQGQHLRDRRKHEALEVIAAIPHALSRITHLGRRPCGGHVYSLVGEVASGRLLLVGIKFVWSPNARSGEDEPPRDPRRLHFLRGWSHEHIEEVFP